MKRLWMLGCVLLLAAAEPTPSVDALGWMSGDWEQATGDRWTEEHWTGARAGMMMGVSRSGNGATAESFEYMRIAPGAGGALHFHASPQGAAAVSFRQVSSGPTEAVFENAANDYPQRIRYWLDGDRLMAEVSALDGTKPMRWIYQRR